MQRGGGGMTGRGGGLKTVFQSREREGERDEIIILVVVCVFVSE